MTFDLAASLRQLKPERRTARLKRRPRTSLIYAEDLAPGPIALVPDTNVYINMAAGRLPAAALAIMQRALQFHSAVCLSEIAHGIAHLDPRDPRSRAVERHYVRLTERIPAARIVAPDDTTWLQAGIVTGIVARLQGLKAGQRKALLSDALIFLSAARLGVPVLTQNVGDFDLISQLMPSGKVVFY